MSDIIDVLLFFLGFSWNQIILGVGIDGEHLTNSLISFSKLS